MVVLYLRFFLGVLAAIDVSSGTIENVKKNVI